MVRRVPHTGRSSSRERRSRPGKASRWSSSRPCTRPSWVCQLRSRCTRSRFSRSSCCRARRSHCPASRRATSRRASAGGTRASFPTGAAATRARGTRRTLGACSPRSARLRSRIQYVALLTQSRMLSLALIAAAAYNAYLLFSRRRAYRLWYRDEKDVLQNPHASLEEPPRDAPPPPTWEERARYVLWLTQRPRLVLRTPGPGAGMVCASGAHTPGAAAESARVHAACVGRARGAPLCLFVRCRAHQTLLARARAVVGRGRLAGHARICDLCTDRRAHGRLLVPDVLPCARVCGAGARPPGALWRGPARVRRKGTSFI